MKETLVSGGTGAPCSQLSAEPGVRHPAHVELAEMGEEALPRARADRGRGPGALRLRVFRQRPCTHHGRSRAEVDEDGEEYIRKRPKLLIPDLKFATINLRDENVERNFLQTLKMSGVPISDQSLCCEHSRLKFKEELEQVSKEKMCQGYSRGPVQC